MRVLLVSSIYAPGVGGSSRLLCDIVEHLSAAGHHVEVVTLDLAPDRSPAFDAKQPYRIHRIPPQKLPGLSSLLMQAKLIQLARGGRFDLILSGVAYPSAILARAAQLVTGVPYAIYSHGEDVTCVETRASAKYLLANALQGASLVMTNSSFTRNACVRLGAREEYTLPVHPAIEPEPYVNVSAERVQALRERLGLAGKVVILTLARLAPRKGHDTVVRALPKVAEVIPNVHYLVVGHGEAEPLLQLADSLRVRDRLSVVSHVSDDELPVLFSLCDVYVMVSRWDRVSREVEGFGIVFLEAAAAGKPTIAGNQGGSPDAVEHGVTGLVVDPESVDEVESALANLLGDSAQAARMGSAGRARVERSFRRSTMLARVERLLGGALKQPAHVQR
jgi:phosphatidylinositol alpha-1,6-mannosyltransferase